MLLIHKHPRLSSYQVYVPPSQPQNLMGVLIRWYSEIQMPPIVVEAAGQNPFSSPFFAGEFLVVMGGGNMLT